MLYDPPVGHVTFGGPHPPQSITESLPGDVQMIGIWCITVWQQLGQPDQLRLIELGPGRGTLMADLLRGTRFLQPFQTALKVHLVEVSLVKRPARTAWGNCFITAEAAS